MDFFNNLPKEIFWAAITFAVILIVYHTVKDD